MLFPTVQFAIFFTAVLGLSWLFRRWAGPWRVLMIAASLFFYGYWDERFVPLLAAYIVVNYLIARAIASARDGAPRPEAASTVLPEPEPPAHLDEVLVPSPGSTEVHLTAIVGQVDGAATSAPTETTPEGEAPPPPPAAVDAGGAPATVGARVLLIAAAIARVRNRASTSPAAQRLLPLLTATLTRARDRAFDSTTGRRALFLMATAIARARERAASARQGEPVAASTTAGETVAREHEPLAEATAALPAVGLFVGEQPAVATADDADLPASVVAVAEAPDTTRDSADELPLDGVYVGEPRRASAATPAGRVRWLLAAGIAFDLAGLAWFKYYGFFATSFVETMDSLGVHFQPTLIEVLLPIGISFFTFQAISYIVDVARGLVRPMGFLDFAVYLSFFPHLLSGPIVRASEFAPQLRHQPADGEHRPDDRDHPGPVITANTIPATDACLLILGGLIKKVLVASYLAEHIVDPVFGAPNQFSGPEVLLAIYAFAVLIYADFSGYTDIASGCALLLGFRFPRNFDAPYRALSLQDFWRRWHMSLSRWLRDYVYVPLGGSRGGGLFTARNLLITFILSGLWHGAAWHFVVWGAILGVGIVVERAFFTPTTRIRPAAAAVRWLVTFHVICLGWVFFRADSLDLAFEMLSRIPEAWGSAPLVTATVFLITAGAILLQWVPAHLIERLRNGFSLLPLAPQAAIFASGIVLIEALGPQGVPPFIYFRF